jgi:hypothetical protein
LRSFRRHGEIANERARRGAARHQHAPGEPERGRFQGQELPPACHRQASLQAQGMMHEGDDALLEPGNSIPRHGAIGQAVEQNDRVG